MVKTMPKGKGNTTKLNIGEAGALAALNRLYAQNDAGMQRLADR